MGSRKSRHLDPIDILRSMKDANCAIIEIKISHIFILMLENSLFAVCSLYVSLFNASPASRKGKDHVHEGPKCRVRSQSLCAYFLRFQWPFKEQCFSEVADGSKITNVMVNKKQKKSQSTKQKHPNG